LKGAGLMFSPQACSRDAASGGWQQKIICYYRLHSVAEAACVVPAHATGKTGSPAVATALLSNLEVIYVAKTI